MAQIDLIRFWDKEARRARKEMAGKLLRQVGISGKSLPRKLRSNRRPLGFGKSAGGLPRRLRRGKITTKASGFTVNYGDQRLIGYFHRGFAAQNRKPRPIVGLSQAQQTGITDRAQNEATAQLTKLMKR